MGIVEATVTNKGKKGLIRRFAPYFKKYLWILIFDLFCAALTTVCELALPIIVQQITNRGINDLASLTLSYILRIGGLYIFLKLVDVGATFFMASIGHIMGTKIETDMRRDMFAHLQKLSFSYFDNTKIGQLMSRITTDLFDITGLRITVGIFHCGHQDHRRICDFVHDECAADADYLCGAAVYAGGRHVLQ